MAAAQPALRALSNLLRNAAMDRACPLLHSLARGAADTVRRLASIAANPPGHGLSLRRLLRASFYRASLLRASGHALRHGSRQ
jgi:hypothetical protein